MWQVVNEGVCRYVWKATYCENVYFNIVKLWIFLQLPDLKDAEAVQKFFLEEIQLGEELLAQGYHSMLYISKKKNLLVFIIY